MNIKTKDLIKVLPFSESYKRRLVGQYDGLNPDQRLAVADILWNTYREYHKMRLDENLNLGFAAAGKNQENLDQNFYKRALQKTEKQLEEEATKAVTDFDLASTREELSEIVGESTKKSATKASKPTTV